MLYGENITDTVVTEIDVLKSPKSNASDKSDYWLLNEIVPS